EVERADDEDGLVNPDSLPKGAISEDPAREAVSYRRFDESPMLARALAITMTNRTTTATRFQRVHHATVTNSIRFHHATVAKAFSFHHATVTASISFDHAAVEKSVGVHRAAVAKSIIWHTSGEMADSPPGSRFEMIMALVTVSSTRLAGTTSAITV